METGKDPDALFYNQRRSIKLGTGLGAVLTQLVGGDGFKKRKKY